MTPVETFHWNPRRPRFRGRFGRYIPLRPRLNNFGDLLGPIIVQEILRREALDPSSPSEHRRLLSVGSVMHFARSGDVVWGTGVNGKYSDHPPATDLDVRAVRGPGTREYLMKHGIDAPAIYGDPGLLMSSLWPEYKNSAAHEKFTAVMNFNDGNQELAGVQFVDPRSELKSCISKIASSSLVVGSSLHGIIVAESYGIPARLVRSQHEPAFKYDDYYQGTGRNTYTVADSVEHALELGGESKPIWSPETLLGSFPRDLWEPSI